MDKKIIVALLTLAALATAGQQGFAQINEQEPLTPQAMKGEGVSINQVDSKSVEQNGVAELIQSHQIKFHSVNDTGVVHLIGPAPQSRVLSSSFDIDMMIDGTERKSAQRAFVAMALTQRSGSNTVKIIMDAVAQKVIFEQYSGQTLSQTYEEPVDIRPGWTYHVNIIRDLNDPGHDLFGIFPAGPLPPDVDQHSVTFVRTFSEIGFPVQIDLNSAFYFVGTEKSTASFWKESLKLVRE